MAHGRGNMRRGIPYISVDLETGSKSITPAPSYGPLPSATHFAEDSMGSPSCSINHLRTNCSKACAYGACSNHHSVFTGNGFSYVHVCAEHVHFSFWMSNYKFYDGFRKHQVNDDIYMCPQIVWKLGIDRCSDRKSVV